MTSRHAQTHVFFNLAGLMLIASLGLGLIWPNSTWIFQAPEICDNAIDDDNDGMIDLNDTDCDCTLLEPISLIANPSFEDQNCCPQDRGSLNCADGWIQASEATTDYLHTCGWMGWENFEVPLPFPDGNGAVGFRDGRAMMEDQESEWKEYAGSRLLSPLLKDNKYRFEFHVGFVDRDISPDIEITFFGSTDTINLPFGVGNSQFGCPTNGPGWKRLGSKRVSGNGQNRWVKSSIDVTPTEDINAIAIGPPCRASRAIVSTYYYFDNLILADLRSFEFVITPTDHPCSQNFSLTVPAEEGIDYQWYKEGVALINENEPQLSKSYGEGEYRVRIIGQNQCLVTKSYNYEIPIINRSESLTICNNEAFQFGRTSLEQNGNYMETFVSAEGCDSIVQLQLEVLPPQSSTVDAFIFEGETYDIGTYSFLTERTHAAIETTDLGCDSTISVNLSYFNLYEPNIFSPNGDNTNDFYIISGDEHLVEISSLTIYDRWGGEVYNEVDLISNNSTGWNGNFNNTPLNPGSYTYVYRVMMDDQLERTKTGTLLLIR